MKLLFLSAMRIPLSARILWTCGITLAPCLSTQAAYGQPQGVPPTAISLDATPTGNKPTDSRNQQKTPDPSADLSKPTDGVPVKATDCAASGAWLTWTQYRPLSMTAGVVFTGLVLVVFTAGRPQRLLLGQDNRYSNSKCQMALWFFIVISAYMTVFLVRLKSCVVGGIGIPPHLLLLSGFSAVTFVGAKAITTSKVNNAEVGGLVNPKQAAPPAVIEASNAVAALDAIKNAILPAPLAAAAVLHGAGTHAATAGTRPLKYLFADLTSNDGLKIPNPDGGPPLTTGPMLDIGDTQMIVIALVAVLTYLVLVYNFLGSTNFSLTPGIILPDVDSTLLSLFGLGQGAYLAKKAVGNAGES